MLCDRTTDPKLAEKLLKFHKRLSDDRSPGADTVATIVDTILPLHFDVAVLRQAYRQRKNDGKSLLVNLVVTDFGAEMLMAALANRRAELCSLPPRKHPNQQVKRIGSRHQHEFERPAPKDLPTGAPLQQELHDTMQDMAQPFLQESDRRILERLNESELASRVAVFEEALKREFNACEILDDRTPFWVYMFRSEETEEDRGRRERIFEEITRRVQKITFVELFVAKSADNQESLFVRLLQTRFQDTKES